mmetsp:Transcript_74524/g.199238  ORF Transcript_74524/g.199238 Transcript_74524/m.199238 type:complete len:256 (-) Transcript_74524:620-1387(-)
MEGIVQNLFNAHLVFLGDEILQLLTKNFLPSQTCDVCRFIVPLINQAVCVDSKNRRIGRVNKSLKLLSNPCLFHLHLLALCNILPHSQHAYHISTDISSSGRIQQHFHAAHGFLIKQRKLEISRFLAVQGVVENLSDGVLIFFRDEILDKIPTDHLMARITGDGRCFVIPFIHKAVGIDSKNRRIGRVNECLEFLCDPCLLHFYLFSLCDILARPNRTSDSSINITTSSCVQKQLNTSPILCIQWKLKIRRLVPM